MVIEQPLRTRRSLAPSLQQSSQQHRSRGVRRKRVDSTTISIIPLCTYLQACLASVSTTVARYMGCRGTPTHQGGHAVGIPLQVLIPKSRTSWAVIVTIACFVLLVNIPGLIRREYRRSVRFRAQWSKKLLRSFHLLQPIPPKQLHSVGDPFSTKNQLQLHPGLIPPNFTFPSVEDRVKYYMSTWYNRTVTTDICSQALYYQIGMHEYDAAYLWDEHNLKVMYKTTTKTAARNYAEEALHYFFPFTPTLFRAMIMFGDGTRFVDHIPLIGKTRIATAQLKNPKEEKQREIIVGFLEVDRHFGYVERLPLGPPWHLRQDALIWRGDSTGGDTRFNIIRKYINHSIHNIDLAFTRLVQGYEKDHKNEHLLRPFLTQPQLMQYKYLLSMEGNDVASGLKWMLYSGSVVFMSPPKHVSWALEEFLVPYVHYIPVKDDYSNLYQQVQWARQHDEWCYNISRYATQFILDLYMSPMGQRNHHLVLEQLAQRYAKQYGKVLAQCPTNTSRKVS